LFTHDIDTRHYIAFKLGRRSETRKGKRVTPEFGEKKKKKIYPQIQGVTIGDHGGGVNLVGECSRRSVHGEVAGSHGGEVAGGATGHNRRRGSV
jgi:hypothetical protein